MIDAENIEKIEIQLLLDAIEKAYGYDFHHYAQSSLKRRITHFMSNSNNTNSYLQLTELLLHDSNAFEDFLKNMSITVSEMFRDPEFYRSFRNLILPILETYPLTKIWCAGCASGEEIYSIAILLHESGLLKKATLYATDFNNASLNMAKKAIYPAEHMKKYINNYNKFGGKENLSSYYTAKYGAIKMHDFLREKVTFANHNLVTDGSFGEMNVISCRNVMIYFDEKLKNRVLELFKNSLCHRGFLCLGTKETLNYTSVEDCFDVIDPKMKLYQKR